MNEMAQLIERREGPYGEVVLRRRGECFEIIANGCFLMDSSDGRSERLLISAALDMLDQPHGASLLIGGLGIGFSLAEASADPRPGQICVVERERAVIDWHTRGTEPLRRFAGTGHDDPRTRIVHDDLLQHLRTASERYDAVCLDIDNGPGWTMTSARAPEFTGRLASRFAQVVTMEVPALAGRRGQPDLVILARRA
jgi:predicted membrane-bound spermidine synthase